MELKFALLADHVAELVGGKLVIVGEFDVLWSTQAPVVHGPFFLVARFEARVTEGSEHKLRVALVDEDGKKVIPPSPDVPVLFVTRGPGYPLRGQVVVHFTSVQFPKFGDYEFHLLIDGRVTAVVPLHVRRAKPVPGQEHVKA